MKLKEILLAAPLNSYIRRSYWKEHGSSMKIPIGKDVKHNLSTLLTLTEESINANDWEIVDD
jgi:hypothetical protein